MPSFSWRTLVSSTSGACGLWFMYVAAESFFTASTRHIERVLTMGAIGIGFVLWGVVHSIRHARTQERLRAEMIAELRASRTLLSADPLELRGENIQVRQREKAEAANIARGD